MNKLVELRVFTAYIVFIVFAEVMTSFVDPRSFSVAKEHVTSVETAHTVRNDIHLPGSGLAQHCLDILS